MNARRKLVERGILTAVNADYDADPSGGLSVRVAGRRRECARVQTRGLPDGVNREEGVYMGQQYELKCAACAYGIQVTAGIGMMYSPHAVFYGRCGDPGQNWSLAFPDGYCKDGKPLLLSLVESQRIKDAAFGLMSRGATPDDEYGHELYACPNCKRLANRFYSKLTSTIDQYEPDYHCSNCRTQLRRLELEQGHDDQIEIVDRNHRKVHWKCPECGCENLIYRADGYLGLNLSGIGPLSSRNMPSWHAWRLTLGS
jgi:hypothetical protein